MHRDSASSAVVGAERSHIVSRAAPASVGARERGRDEEIIRRLAVDPHSPDEVRCNAVVRNVDEFYTAFGVQEGDGLYLAPEERVRIW